MRCFKFSVTLSLFIIIAFGSLIFGQTQKGTINGRVTDETGAVLPGVTVTITSAALITGTNVTTSNEYGVYKFIALPPGTYDVKFELEGFRPIEKTDIKISAYFVAKVDAVLSIAVLEEVLTVTGEAPAVDTTSNVSSTSFDKNLLEHIPSGRDLWVVAEQVPGVAMDKALEIVLTYCKKTIQYILYKGGQKGNFLVTLNVRSFLGDYFDFCY